MYGILVLGGYIASLLAASVAMLIASKTRAMSIAAVVPFVLFCVSPFIGRVLPFRTFFSLTPDQLTNILNCARIPYIYQIGNVVFRQIPFIIVFYAVLAAGLLPLITFSLYSQKIIDKRHNIIYYIITLYNVIYNAN